MGSKIGPNQVLMAQKPKAWTQRDWVAKQCPPPPPPAEHLMH